MEIKLAYFSFKTHLHVCDIKFDIWPVARGVLFSLRASVNALETRCAQWKMSFWAFFTLCKDNKAIAFLTNETVG